MTEDAELLRRYAHDRAEEAFAEFVRRHVNLVYSVAYRRTGGDAQLAEEVVQTVFTSVARKASALSRHAAVAGWLFTSTRYAAAVAARANQRRKRREQEARAMEDLERSDPVNPEWEKLRPLIDELLETLNARDREAMLLRFYDGCSFAQIGSKLRLSDDAARRRVDRALERLGSLLERRGVPSTAAALALVLANQAAAAPTGLAASVTVAATVSAATSLTPGVALLQFMTTTKVSTGLTVLILAAAATLATHEARGYRGIEDELAAATRDYTVVEKSLQTLQQRAATAELKVTAALTEADQLSGPLSPTANSTAKQKPSVARIDPVLAGKAFLKRHPEVMKSLTDRARAHIASLYGPYYKAWGLSSEKIQQFEALLMEGVSFGAAADDGENVMYLSPGTGMPRDEMDRRVRALLGENAYGSYRETKDLAPVRQMVADLASSLYYTDTPLTGEQIQQLNQVIVDARKTPLPSALRWAGAAVKAKALLSPEQRDAADDLLAKRDLDQALSAAMQAKISAPKTKPSS